LFELDSDIAFVTNFSNFEARDVEACWKGFTDATWQTLPSLSHEPTLTLHPRIAGPNFCDEVILGLDIAIETLETVVVVAISSEYNLSVECLNLHKNLTSKPENYKNIHISLVQTQCLTNLKEIPNSNTNNTNRLWLQLYIKHSFNYNYHKINLFLKKHHKINLELIT
jgi:hypothetical protein